MKIAIITYHRANNFGSALQAYALSTTLSKLGHNPEVIDFHTKAQDDLYRIFEKPHSMMSVARNLHSFVFYSKITRRKKRFSYFLNNNLSLSRKQYSDSIDMSSLNNEYDMFICGSDQIWNASCADFSTAYLLDFVNDKNRCFSYAASIGKSYIDKNDSSYYEQYLKNFKHISVRETVAKQALSEIIDNEIDVVPDPVLLLNRHDWDKLGSKIKIPKKYIFCYFIGDVKGMRSFAKQMSQKSKLPLVLININLRDLNSMGKRYYDAGPEEFLVLLRNAQYVCTNSYHAVLFSLIYNKNYWVFTDLNSGSAKSRIEEISRRVSLENRILNSGVIIPKDPFAKIDYSNINKVIKKYSDYGRSKLIDYLGE